MFFSPSVEDGGADRILITLLRRLDRKRFTPSLVLVRREGAMVDEIPADVEVTALGATRLAVSAPALAREIRTRRPDVVFSTHGGSNIIAAAAHALARSSSRLVLSERSALVRLDRSRARRMLEIPAKRLTYRRADVVTAVSMGVARQLATMVHLSEDRIRVVYNPMIDEELTIRAADPVVEPWFAGGVPVVLAIGRLVPVKDYPTLLRAFARIRAVLPVRLAILGDGPMRGELEGLARELGVAADTRFLGFDKNPFKYMARARLVLHASQAEGLPGALIQAMACGTPVVATDCDFGPREVITHGRDGFLVKVGDARGLAEQALAVLQDPALAGRLAQQARVAASRFSTTSSLSRYEAAITGQAAAW